MTRTSDARHEARRDGAAGLHAHRARCAAAGRCRAQGRDSRGREGGHARARRLPPWSARRRLHRSRCDLRHDRRRRREHNAVRRRALACRARLHARSDPRRRRVSAARLLGNWTIVWIGNFVGAFATAILLFLSEQYTFGDGAVGQTALSIAAGKTSLGFVEAVALGMLCNGLVCLAVWLTYGAHTTTDKILAIVPPIAAFVAAGFEHSVANMYFISIALLIETDEAFVASLDPPSDLSGLSWGSFFTDNLLPVTIGNIIGGAVLVGAVYWFVYLRRRPLEDAVEAPSTGSSTSL